MLLGLLERDRIRVEPPDPDTSRRLSILLGILERIRSE